MVNVEWCHDCNQPECRKACNQCEHFRKLYPAEAAKLDREAAAKTEQPSSRYVADHVHSQPAAVETMAKVDPPKAVNPKDGIGNTKLPLHLWPFSATAHGSLALLDGLLKYGRMNWRGTEVRASVYVGALLRHVGEWLEGVNVDAKSGLHPLAHALACLAIIVDAEAAGTLVDDRNYPGGYAALAEALTSHAARLQALYADVQPPHHWTIQDALVAANPSVSSRDATDG
jgi:Domain of unknown function (DUF5664)